MPAGSNGALGQDAFYDSQYKRRAVSDSAWEAGQAQVADLPQQRRGREMVEAGRKFARRRKKVAAR